MGTMAKDRLWNSQDAELTFFNILIGNTLNAHDQFKRQLCNKIRGLTEVFSLEECDFILAFCPIVSRAGTDIEAAVEKIPDSKPAILVVLHYTRDPEAILPDCRIYVTKENIFTFVNCLFHEDYGLLECQKNSDAVCDCTQQLFVRFELETSTELISRRQSRMEEIQEHCLGHEQHHWNMALIILTVILVILCILASII